MGEEQEYYKAVRMGKASFLKLKIRGKDGHLVSLLSFLEESKICGKENLGVMEIPLEKVVGTYTSSRAEAFSANFMPLIHHEDSEFKTKWTSLYKHHMNEGIKDPIKVYEYLNYYYVVEGNKRVSVLKYLGAYSIVADVIRLIPEYNEEDEKIKLYYKFLKFNKKTSINSIWFSKEENFDLMDKFLNEYNPTLEVFDDKYKHFISYVYDPFREIFHKCGGNKLSVTTSDAVLEYIKIYGIPQEFNQGEKTRIITFIKELEAQSKNEKKVISEPIKTSNKGIFTSLTTIIPRKKIKVGFIYKGSIKQSGWTYAHECARLHLDKTFGSKITTTYIEKVCCEDAYEKISLLVKEGYDIIFTTHPTLKNATLKAALDYPKVKFLNCSDSLPLKHVIMYYGRMYEPRFLMGLLAGTFTKTNTIGYVAHYPIRETIVEINAFSLGAQMVNPRAKVKVLWNTDKRDGEKLKPIKKVLEKENVDIVCYHELPAPESNDFQYGLCSLNLEEKTDENFLFSHYANIILNWKNFYEKFLTLMINGEDRNIFDIWAANTDLINYWLGMDSGIIDVIYSNRYIPKRSQMLIELFKKMILEKEFNPFTGPIFDCEGNLKIKESNSAAYEDLLSMDWFVDGVESIVDPYNNQL
ncbi:BMP family ABC transporter substrate-binding protein [Haloimpatiens sp. FM7330]|uniref:BMP family ABC transporter substrate-binding protein n=1 Tax=Haloimpatiens sp. FM7330 TaxID=3298610 RepID=UPI00363A566E